MKNGFVGVTFAFLALTFCATAGWSGHRDGGQDCGNGYGYGNEYGYGGGYGYANQQFGEPYGSPYGNHHHHRPASDAGRAVRHLVNAVKEAIGLRPENDWHRRGHHHHGFNRQPGYAIQQVPVVVPVQQVYPFRPVRRYQNQGW